MCYINSYLWYSVYPIFHTNTNVSWSPQSTDIYLTLAQGFPLILWKNPTVLSRFLKIPHEFTQSHSPPAASLPILLGTSPDIRSDPFISPKSLRQALKICGELHSMFGRQSKGHPSKGDSVRLTIRHSCSSCPLFRGFSLPTCFWRLQPFHHAN